MPQEGFSVILASKENLNPVQQEQLRRLIVPYSKHQEYTSPLELNLSPASYSRWVCTLDSGGNVVGFARLHLYPKKRVVKLLDIYVKPELQRKGLARSMLVRALGFARGNKRSALVVDWIDPRTFKPFVENFANVLKERSSRFFRVGYKRHPISKRDSAYLGDYYGKGSFGKGLQAFNEKYPNQPVLKKGKPGQISDVLFKLKPRRPGEKASGPPISKALFSPQFKFRPARRIPGK